jgi:mono/diheme cytochrome c family protein
MNRRSSSFRFASLFLLPLAPVSACVGEIAQDSGEVPATSAPKAPAASEPSAAAAPGSPAAAPGVTPAVGPSAPGATPPTTTQPAQPGLPPGAPAPKPAAADGPPGILGCPTTEAPAYGSATSVTLSRAFQASCATCHGGAGEGKGKYPPVPGKLTLAEYIAKIRAGVREMPAFPADFVSDADLKADFGKLEQLALSPGSLMAVGEPPSAWSAAKVEEVYRKGLAAWRKPGAVDQQACVNCHSADGIELAVIGFSDDSILRRGQQHVSPEDALAIRDFIHAQRRRYGLSRTCSTDWRPFQPGGTVLPGTTRNEQDAAFMGVLKKRGLLVAAGKVVTLDDAKRAFTELQAVDLRQLPMGLPLPRWSEDKFNGPEHRDINDYMPAVPHIPNRPAEYFALEDEYLANPTDATLYKLIDQNKRNMNDGGYAARYTTQKLPGNCGYQNSTEWFLNIINRPKRLNVLISAHLFREELKKPGSFYKRPAAPFPDAPFPMNPAFTLGGFTIEPPCYDDNNYPSWIKSFPAGFREELPEVDLMKGVISNSSDRVTHPWMSLGQLLDPSLISTDGMQDNKLHYWAFRNFTQKEVHLPFMYVHRIATQTTYWTTMRGTALYPKTQGPFSVAHRDWLAPLLSTSNQESAGLQSAIDPASKTLPAADVNAFKGNLIRTMMLLSRELLQKGAALQMDQNYDHCLAVTCQTGEMNGYIKSLATYATNAAGKAALAAQGFDLALYNEDTGRLLKEVQDLMAKAPRRTK